MPPGNACSMQHAVLALYDLADRPFRLVDITKRAFCWLRERHSAVFRCAADLRGLPQCVRIYESSSLKKFLDHL